MFEWMMGPIGERLKNVPEVEDLTNVERLGKNKRRAILSFKVRNGGTAPSRSCKI